MEMKTIRTWLSDVQSQAMEFDHDDYLAWHHGQVDEFGPVVGTPHSEPMSAVRRRFYHFRNVILVLRMRIGYTIGAAMCKRYGHTNEEVEEFVSAEYDHNGRMTDCNGGGVDWYCPRCGQGGRNWF